MNWLLGLINKRQKQLFEQNKQLTEENKKLKKRSADWDKLAANQRATLANCVTLLKTIEGKREISPYELAQMHTRIDHLKAEARTFR